MFYVLLVLSIFSAVVRLWATAVIWRSGGRELFLLQHPGGVCTLFGPVLPDDCPRGTRVHEWTHFFTMAPWIHLLLGFSWIPFYNHGWLAACLIGLGVNCIILMILEGVADVAAMIVVGPRAFMEELTQVYRGLGVTPVGMLGTCLAYPPWRLYPMLRAMRD